MPFNSPRFAILLVFAAYGAMVGVWVGSIPQVVAATGYGAFGLGTGLTVSTLAGVVAAAGSGLIGRHFSNRAAILTLVPLLWLSVMALLLTSGPLHFHATLVAFGVALGLSDVFMNAEAAFIEDQQGRPIFTSFHASVSFGVAVFAVIGSLVSTNFGPAFAGLATLPLAALAWLAVRAAIAARQPGAQRPSGAPPRSALPGLTLLGIVAGLVIAVESAALFWSARLLNEQAPSLAQFAGLGVSFFAMCNVVVRLLGDRLRARFGDLPLMLASLALAVVAFAALGASATFAASLVAFALAGFGVAMLVPCILNIASQQTPNNRAAALGYVFALAGPTRIGAPWLFGWIAAGHSTAFAFGLCAAVVLLALILLALLPRFVASQPQRTRA